LNVVGSLVALNKASGALVLHFAPVVESLLKRKGKAAAADAE